MDHIKNFIINSMPAAVVVFNQRMDIIFSNRQAELFFRRFVLPDEIKTICRRIFDEIRASRVKDSFPGDIHLSRKLVGSLAQWSFKIRICEEPDPFVIVYITQDSLADRIDLNVIRGRFRLTRRETDVLRRAISGLKSTDIAEDLEISDYTVRDHLSSIYMKMGIERRTELTSVLLNYLQP